METVSPLIQINVWLDIVFVVIYIFMLLFLMFHFTLFVTTGRFRKSFIEGHWAEHDSRPPATPKWLHAGHMVSMIILGFTGMYLRFPFLFRGSAARATMRNMHYVFMIVVIVILVWRVWYAFFSKNKDYKEFAIGKKDLATFMGVLAYYGYFSNNKPHVAKYNVMQKLSYNMFLVMMVVQAITGLLIFRVPFMLGHSPNEFVALVGGINGVWALRTVHYILNWLFIILTTVHFYLAASADVPCALDFFGLTELEVHPHGHDDGDEDSHGAPAVEPAPQAASY